MVVVFATRWFLSGSSSRGKRIAGSVHFKGSIGIRILCGLGAPTAFYGAGVVALSSTFRSDWWVCIILAAVGVSAIAMWPEEIITTSQNISQSRFFGLGNRTDAWADIEYATENPANGNIESRTESRKEIRSHTPAYRTRGLPGNRTTALPNVLRDRVQP
jgi:hypothetical protein